jgi:hypothetical protein
VNLPVTDIAQTLACVSQFSSLMEKRRHIAEIVSFLETIGIRLETIDYLAFNPDSPLRAPESKVDDID